MRALSSKAVSLVFIAAIVDCVALPIAVFVAIARFVDTRPALAAYILMMATVVLFALTLVLLPEGGRGNPKDSIHRP